jgi:hypothetical protein
MKQVRSLGFLSLAFLLCSLLGHTQQTSTAGQGATVIVPPLVNFSSVLTDGNGKPLNGVVGVTFYLYKDSQGGSPLWMETQNVQPDKVGHYKVMLGSTTTQGLPAELFASGEARWLGVQVQGKEEQPRVSLLSVPYALKALDAETLGGKPASAFVASTQANSNSGSRGTSDALSGSGKKNYIPLWLSATKLGDSNIFQSATGNLGLGTTAPAAQLDVNGASDLRNTLTLFPNRSAPTLLINGTGFKVSNTGFVGFVKGQTFPGTGTITGVTTASGSGLSGGGTTGTLNLSLLKTCTINQVLQWNGSAWGCATAGIGTITGVTPGTDLTGGGTSGNVTLNLDTTKVPQLNAANTFTGNQVINGNLSDAGNISAAGSIVGQTGSLTANSNGEVLLITQNGSGGALVGQSSGSQGVAGLATATSGVTTGVSGVSESATGFGVEGAGATGVRGVGLSSKGAAGLFENQNGGAILIGLGPGLATVFNVDGSGNLTTNGSINSALTLQGNVTDPCAGFVSANVIGGSGNIVNSGVTGATIGGGGSGNLVTDDFGTVGGGRQNEAGDNSGLTCDASFATVAGGLENTASGPASIVAGGELNISSGNHSTVAGGGFNTASGQYSFVAGGADNEAVGDFSFAAGQSAVATDSGAFLWCADDGSQCGSAGPNSFEVAVYGPIFFYDGPNGSGCNLSAGGGSWNCSSDRNLKDNIVPIDSRSVLERVAQLPITQWKMKAEPAGRKHIGPMAQDFYAAFGLGDNDRYIALGDGQGVALAAVQALYQIVQEKDGQIRKINQQLQSIREMDSQLKRQLQELHHAQSRKLTSLEERLTRLEAQGRMARTGRTTTEAQGKQRFSQPGGGI